MIKHTFAIGLAVVVCGCSVTNQLHSDLTYRGVSAEVGQFGSLTGIGVLTPSTPTGHESDKQALADALGQALEESESVGTVLPLTNTLSAINTAGLARAYAEMLAEYEHTGVLERDTLKRIGEAAGVRYLAKLNLGDFVQSSDKRLAIAGIRLFDTWRALIRVHLEVWDSRTGTIVWEGNEELVFAHEGAKERPVSFRQVAGLASAALVAKMGESGSDTIDEAPPELVTVSSTD
ncbi:MAG TPA: hypothetical protein VF322_17960 [Gammaproteobacteria bacterium]